MYQGFTTEEIEEIDSVVEAESASGAQESPSPSPSHAGRQRGIPFALPDVEPLDFSVDDEEGATSVIDTLSLPSETPESLLLDSQPSLPTSLPDRFYQTPPDAGTTPPLHSVSLSTSPATAPPHFTVKASHPDAISLTRRNSLESGSGIGGMLRRPAPLAASRGPVRRTAVQQFKPSISPGQPVPGRTKDKFVSLPAAILEGAVGEEEEALLSDKLAREFDELLPEDHEGTRISAFCIADSLDRTTLREHADTMAPSLTMLHFYDDVIHAQYTAAPGADRPGDVFFFDYGCVAFCGLTPSEEQQVLKQVAAECAVGILPESLAETDALAIVYNCSVERPRVANDRISLPREQVAAASEGSPSGGGFDHRWPLSVAHAMAQSVKLYTVEARVLSLVAATKHLPEVLASTGQVLVGPGEVTQLIGRVLMHKADINLLLPVLDTPEFFWSAPDAMQHLYEKVCDYLELGDRVQVLNTRVGIVEEMLDMLRAQQNYSLHSRLEWIIIFLILADTLPAVLKAFFL